MTGERMQVDWVAVRKQYARFSDDDFERFKLTAEARQLNPLLRQIYLVPRKENGVEKGVIMVGIDGLRLEADRTGSYAGSDDIAFNGAEGDAYPYSATATVYKLVAGMRCPFAATARWPEYYPGDGNIGDRWRRMPCVLLGKCAEALALRKAFPAETSGLYISEEMDQANTEGISEPKAAKTVAPPAEPKEDPERTQEVKAEPKRAAAAKNAKAEPKPESKFVTPAPDASSFGYKPERWPVEEAFGAPATEMQTRMQNVKATERDIRADVVDIDKLRRIVIGAYGIVPAGEAEPATKGEMSLFIDWLSHSTEDAIEAALNRYTEVYPA